MTEKGYKEICSHLFDLVHDILLNYTVTMYVCVCV